MTFLFALFFGLFQGKSQPYDSSKISFWKLLSILKAQCLKITQNVSFEFFILHLTCLVTPIDRKHFGFFDKLLTTQNVFLVFLNETFSVIFKHCDQGTLTYLSSPFLDLLFHLALILICT